MIKETILSRSVRMIFAGGVAMGVLLPAMAQVAAEQPIQRVEITGSSIKRIAQEGALPVQTLTRKDIEMTGLQNVADLVAAMPSMQGMLTASASINGGGGGVQAASIHALGTDYTLVLLNGRRIAPYGTGSAVNLASIPLSAVDRVEILTDGASTLYGSDAIAGVINFILKKNQTDLSIDASYNRPQEKGGQSANVAITKGFGSLEKDGFNVMVSYSHDDNKALWASQRDFSKSGVRAFEQGGKKYVTWQNSINSIPANADVYDADGHSATFSPDLVNNGKCSGPNTFARGGVCRYDYPATVQLIPQLKRDSVFTNANWKINDDTTVYGEFVASSFSSRATYAAPAQPLTTITTDPVSGVRSVNPAYIGAYNKSVLPLLRAQGVDPDKVTDAFFYFRAFDAGGRTDDWKTDARHLALGIDSRYAGWDMTATYTHSENKQKDDAVAGYMSANRFDELVMSGKYNPYIINPNAAAILAPAVLQQNLSTTKSKIDVVQARASRELFPMAGGTAALGSGLDFTRQAYKDLPSQMAMGPGPGNPGFTDTNIGGGTGSQPLDASRKNWGAFAELQMPAAKGLELTAAVRYDSYDAVEKRNVSYDVAGNPVKPGALGTDVSRATYKVSAKWQPAKELMIRGSYGTGFRAPTLNNIADPLKNNGSSNFFACPITKPTDPRFPYCRGESEYGLLKAGNPSTGADALKPETSKQFTLGFRLEPFNALSFGMDFWDVKLKNQIDTLSQDQIFKKPELADKYISIYFDPIQKAKVLVATQTPVNLASSHFRGIDIDSTVRANTAVGRVSANWTATYMMKAERDVPGVGTESSLARFDGYDNVTFRWINRVVLSLKSSEQLNQSLTMNYHSKYHDKEFVAGDGVIRVPNADGTYGATAGIKRDVSAYTTFDYQAKYNFTKTMSLTAGIRNLLDKDPPLSVRNTGGGNQVGFDGRYTDPLGRTFYLTGQYRF